jgi:HK97 family phage prohead protease
MPTPKEIEKKEYLAFKFKVNKANADENTGTIEGFASTFGNVDYGSDVIMPGAFARTLENNKGRFPILLDHCPWDPAGYNTEAEETDKGLRVKGELKLFDPKVRQRFELMKLSLDVECPMGLSIGYRAIQYDYVQMGPVGQERTVRRLKEIQLFEYSPVMFPMNDEAGITGAKAAAMATLFARLQKPPYDLEVIKKALEELNQDAGEPRPAKDETDPALRHSVDRLLAAFGK